METKQRKCRNFAMATCGFLLLAAASCFDDATPFGALDDAADVTDSQGDTGDSLVCESDTTNACGGCAELAGAPGDACDACGEAECAFVCDGAESVSCDPVSTAPDGFALVPAGTFTVGSPSGELGRFSSETQHTVTLTRDFLMQTTEVTQGQWQALMGNNPSSFGSCGDACPVERVTWWEAAAYANALSESEGLTACYSLTGCSRTPGTGMECSGATATGAGGNPYNCVGYRLPTESEWEYAARAGTTTATYLGNLQAPFNCDPQPNLEPIAWYCENSGDMPHPVAGLGANAWGLYDMLGNVWEWTWDGYDGDYPGSTTDPTGASGGSYRVLRGGSWGFYARFTRAAYRSYDFPGYRFDYLGFRLARTAP